jgi:hypothetical protein
VILLKGEREEGEEKDRKIRRKMGIKSKDVSSLINRHYMKWSSQLHMFKQDSEEL